jgi:hypothetical protein
VEYLNLSDFQETNSFAVLAQLVAINAKQLHQIVPNAVMMVKAHFFLNHKIPA